MRKLIILFLFLWGLSLQAQVILKVEGQAITNSNTGWWDGYNVARAEPTTFSFLNNSVTSVNATGYQLQAGDEVPGPTNNNLDGAVITGNKFTWNGTDGGSITHGVFMGYNINYTVKYNYLDKVPYGILFKAGTDAGVNMTYSTGYGAAYNIVKNAKLSVRSKGMNGFQVYNNTFYTNISGWYMIYITPNTDRTNYTWPTGIKIKNNIFYTVYNTPVIDIGSASFSGFECDYNIYYCESTANNYPTFTVDGATKTWAQWRALGYDAHSVVINPNFIDLTNFVPYARLDYGTNLGATWQDGLATNATWVVNQSPGLTTQNGTWQVGARVYSGGGGGTTYYLSPYGNDLNSGTSISAPWKTVAKVNASSFSAGSTILLKRGGVWNERLIPPSSGTSGSPITFGAYDSGNDPVITARGELPGWSNAGNWTEQGGYKWSIYYGGNYRHRLWLDGTEAREAQYTSTLSSTLRFYSDNNAIWVYSTTSPWLAFSSIDVSGVRSQAMYVLNKNYITFKNIDFQGGGGGGWDCVTLSGSNYIVFDACKIGKDAGCYGLKMTDSDNNEIKNCTFDTGDRTFDLWQAENSEDGIAVMDGCDNNLIHHNYFQDWGHTTMALTKNQNSSSVTNNKFYYNTVTYTTCDFGRGFGAGGPLSGSYTGNAFYNNHIYNTPTASMVNFPYLDVFNNIIDNVTGAVAYGYGYNYGIGLQEYLVGSTQYRAVGMRLFNNTIVNCYGPGIEIIGWQSVDMEQNQFVNNILAGNGRGSGENNIQFEGDNYSTVNSNIYRNNLFYSSATNNVIRYRGSTMTVAQFNGQTGNNGDVMANNISGNPLFVVNYSNLHLQTGSPAIDAGYSPTLSSYDRDGVAWGSPPTIGAYEYTGAVSLPTVTTSAVSNISYTTASGGGNVTSDGGATVTARGVCWHTSSNPTISNPKTNNGTGTGSFASDIVNLQSNTTYYVRAYATNSQGTAYGANVQFKTLEEEEPPPTGDDKLIKSGDKFVKSGDKITKW